MHSNYLLPGYPSVLCSRHLLTTFLMSSSTVHECQVPTAAPTRLPTMNPTATHTSYPSIYTAPHGLSCYEVSTAVVAGPLSPGSADGVGLSASFNAPHGMTTSPDGSFVLISDFGNHKIRKLMISTGAVSTFAGDGTAGGVNGIGTMAQFSAPLDVSMSSDGLLAVSSCANGHRIRHIVLSTRLVTTIGGDGSPGHVNGVGNHSRFDHPAGISLYKGNTLALIVDKGNHLLRLIDMSSLQVTTLAGSGTGGGADGIGTSATFSAPFFVAVSSNDEFAVVSEYNGNRLRKVVLSTWAVSTLTGSSNDATGSSNGMGTLATFSVPCALILSSDDMHLYVADRNNNAVRHVELTSKKVSTLRIQTNSNALNSPVGLTWIRQDSVLLLSSPTAGDVQKMYGYCASPSATPTLQPTGMPTAEPSATPSLLPSSEPLWSRRRHHLVSLQI